MATITVNALSAKLKKMGYDTKENSKGYFTAPKTMTGKEFVIYLPAKFGKKDRAPFLKDILITALKEFKPKYISGVGAKSTAGQVGFSASEIFVIAKLISAKGGGENKGNIFETDLENDFKKLINESGKFKYPAFMEQFQKMLKNDTVIKVESTGKLNTPRPLKSDSSGLYVSVKGGGRTSDIGKGLADLIITTKAQKKFNLSLKYGSTVTFFNSGVGKIFIEADFKKGKFSDATAKALLDMFKIDPIRFRNVFMNYKAPDAQGKKTKAEKDIESVTVSANKLKEFIKTVIGKNYHLVHLSNDGTIDMIAMTESFLEKAATPIKNKVDIHYPVGGSAKRIDIKLETSVFELNFNIRNKQGGILPSHIMCDYKIKGH